MPIKVICPGCHASFTASDKFAGQKGPCPKCKVIISIPNLDEQVVIHAPEPEGPTDSQGKSVLKPVKRQDTKLNPLILTAIAGGCIAALLAAFAIGHFFDTPPLPLIGIGLTLISPVIVVGGYSFLHDDELEPYRGTSLWIRAAICGLAFAAMWAGFMFVPAVATAEVWGWAFIGPAFAALGGGIALVTLDLDFANGFFLYCFYLATTLALRWAVGMDAIWAQSISG